MDEKVKFLRPIKESTEDYEDAERRIIEVFKKEIYDPLIRQLGYAATAIQNAGDWDAVTEALRRGRITFYRGTFSGKFNASISKELRALGATWDRRESTYKIPAASLPIEIKNAVSASEAKFLEKVDKIDKRIAQISPAEIAGKISVEKSFDRAIWKTDNDFRETVKSITIAPKLTPEQRKKIAAEWQDNMKLWVKDFVEKEIVTLRKDVQASVFKGNRYESMVGTIQKSYDVSKNKAKFLARQETSLLMSKFKETRYTAAGVNEYKWGCVKMPHDKTLGAHIPGNVRYMHGLLEGKIFRWDSPPITNQKGARNNPGQDFNCRCFAIPVVRFK